MRSLFGKSAGERLAGQSIEEVQVMRWTDWHYQPTLGETLPVTAGGIAGYQGVTQSLGAFTSGTTSSPYSGSTQTGINVRASK
jgi:hypothetical protein